MDILELRRVFTCDQGTVGILRSRKDEICFVLELPWRENKRNISCIPSGEYRTTYLPRSGSGRYRDVYHVQEVWQRSGILVHTGNYAGATDKGYKSHSCGCLLPASSIRSSNGQLIGILSAQALKRIHLATNRQPFTLSISWS